MWKSQTHYCKIVVTISVHLSTVLIAFDSIDVVIEFRPYEKDTEKTRINVLGGNANLGYPPSVIAIFKTKTIP